MNEPLKHYAKWKMPVTQNTTYFIILLIWNVQNKEIYRHRKYIHGFQGPWEGGMRVAVNECRISNWGIENALELDVGNDCRTF